MANNPVDQSASGAALEQHGVGLRPAPDIFTIVCSNDSFQLALDHTTTKTMLRVCKQVQPLLSSKVAGFHDWCQKAGLCRPDGQLMIRLTISDQIALSLHSKGQDTAGISWVVALADQGHAAASYLLAWVLLLASIVKLPLPEVDFISRQKECARHLETAANAGHSMAQLQLADCYYNGIGVDRDRAKAFESYRKLANDGIHRAQVAVGRYYADGEGIDQDFNTAIEWYSKAAAQGSEDGRLHHLMALCLVHGFGTTKDQEKAVAIFEQLANDGRSSSQYWVGKCWWEGWGVSGSYSTAFEWFSKSAEQGSSYGQFMAGVCYKIGLGVDKDNARAFEWLRESAEQGNRYGQYYLGSCYNNGIGIDKDTDTAVFWYRKSADQSHYLAVNELKSFGLWSWASSRQSEAP
ncbi:uncharacterized protein BJ171DRAFT_442394 [Polychytrium aggregatum]|uniref:uncharacterized protein n=1 Tax=Polychytrium aggregatum TaxID=110093 RepID=UPI0022FE9A63|nr:uncharacterized protein BJ171DRAFT_442394 [Polychytrium aggregatum]KAI9204742.1 hypothetical protein BJ171DRAFT_442394 [Polychytrium aggregatum]